MAKVWRSLPCAISELRLDLTLKCGQSFRWRETSDGVWTGVIGRQVWKLKQDDSYLYYQVFNHTGGQVYSKDAVKVQIKEQKQSKPRKIKDETKEEIQSVVESEKDPKQYEKLTKTCKIENVSVKIKVEDVDVEKEFDKLPKRKDENEVLKDYFQLSINLGNLYKVWSKADSNFKDISSKFQGIRMLRQDPVENLFSFICSSNNHISRISSMVEKLCDNYGSPITTVDGKLYHGFPQISSLAESGVEAKLRELGFGYRAKYINTTAKYITENHDEEWLYSLRSIPYLETKRELMKLCGVGAKVADCICLMSMDKPGSIPVDTHVWQIAARHYITKLQNSKSLTDKLYNEIGDCFRELWGEYAGWAHSVLFAADLKQFQELKKAAKRQLKTKEKETKHKKKIKT